MKNLLLWVVLIEILAITAPLAGAQAKRKHSPHWQLTDSEALVRGEYANCDYGFYVLLPNNVVGHANLPPSPNHGFLVGLPDRSTTRLVSFEDARFLWVYAEYDALDLKSLKAASDNAVDLMETDKSGFKLISRKPLKLDSLPGTEITAEYDEYDSANRLVGKVIEKEIIAVRAGIIYEIGLRTTANDYSADEASFNRLRADFRSWKIHYC